MKAAKLPEIEYSGNCTRAPLSYFSQFTVSAAIVGGEIFSYSGKDKQTGERTVCLRSYHAFEKNLGISRATVGRALSALKNGCIKKVSAHGFQSVLEESKNYIRIPYWLNTTKFEINDKARRLTPAERAVFSLIYSYCNTKKGGGNKFSISNSELADLLGLHKSTVSRCIKALVAAGLIIKDNPERDKYGIRKNTYHLNRELLSERRRGHDGKQHIISDNISRTEWYARRRAEAEHRADNNKRVAMSDPAYKRINAQLINLFMDEARAQTKNDVSALTSIVTKRRKLELDMQHVLARLNLTSDDLTPIYHCSKCKDTGFDQRGRPCDCFDKRR